jgi:hypothetical protein
MGSAYLGRARAVVALPSGGNGADDAEEAIG